MTARPERDLWTVFPTAALLGFAGWVALMVETGDPAAVILGVTIFLAGAWRACHWYYQVCRDVDERRMLRARPVNQNELEAYLDALKAERERRPEWVSE